MNIPFTDRAFTRTATRTTVAAFLVSLLYAIPTQGVLAQTPSTQGTADQGAAELETDGQPASIATPSTLQTPSRRNEIDINQSSPSWKKQEQELQLNEEQQQEDSVPDAPPPGSEAPQQTTPDQLTIPF